MHRNLDITAVYSTDKLGNRIHRRAIPFTDNDCCNTCFVFLSWIPSVFTYGGQKSTDTLGKPI